MGRNGPCGPSTRFTWRHSCSLPIPSGSSSLRTTASTRLPRKKASIQFTLSERGDATDCRRSSFPVEYKLLRPELQQPTGCSGEGSPDPDDLEFGLRYWTAAYRFILEHTGEGTCLISYRRLTNEPEVALSQSADTLSLPQDLLRSQSDRLRSPRSHQVNEDDVPARLREEAYGIFQQLDQKSSI